MVDGIGRAPGAIGTHSRECAHALAGGMGNRGEACFYQFAAFGAVCQCGSMRGERT
jgi:hypothetical protein